MNKEELINIDFKNSFKEFCNAQRDCLVCPINKKEYIDFFDGYIEPCLHIYNAMLIGKASIVDSEEGDE